MLGIRVATHYFHITADANCGRIARIRPIGSAVNLLQLCVVHVHTESLFYCVEVGSVPVSCELQRAFHAPTSRHDRQPNSSRLACCPRPKLPTSKYRPILQLSALAERVSVSRLRTPKFRRTVGAEHGCS